MDFGRASTIVTNTALMVATILFTGLAAINYGQKQSKQHGFVTVPKGPYDESGLRINKYPGAPWVVEFADYQCQYCAESNKNIAQGRIKLNVIYRHFPLSNHKYARDAAYAAECAHEQSAFQHMHDLMYADQDSIGVRSFALFAFKAGVSDTVRFNECMKSGRPERRVAEDVTAARALRISGTPTFYYDGRLAAGSLDVKRAEALVKRRGWWQIL